MAQDRTAGYDMLVQVSENEINTQLATAFLAGTILPTSLTVPVSTGGLVGTATLNFATPTADLDRPRPQMGLTLPFTNSQLQVTSPLPITLAPLGGTIVVVDTIQIITQGSNQLATMDFNAGAPTVTVIFDAASAAVLAPALAATGLTLAQAQNLMAGIVVAQLQTTLGRVDLTPPIPIVDDADPTTIFDLDVTTVNDTSAADRDCLAFGVRMANDSGGNINGITQSFIPAGSNSMVMMSNFWLLARVMRPRVATSLGRPVTDFDTPLRLNRNVPAPGGQGTLTRLEARIDGNRIRIDGRATDSGTGWSAVSTFHFFVSIGLAGGALTVSATTPVVDTDVDLAWWVWLASLGLGALFGGIIGAIVAAIVLAIVEAVAGGIVDGLIAGSVGDSLGSIPSVPLGPIGGGLTLTSVILDDLELRCGIVRSLSVPVQSSGSHGAAAGFAIDLDTGTIRATPLASSDLVWDPATGFRTNGAARLRVTGVAWGSLTPVQVSRLSLTGQQLPASLVPFSFNPNFPFFPHDEVVFGVRTVEGRYAKVRAWRSLTEGGLLRCSWVTWATPVPQLDIAARWTVLERGEVTEWIAADCSRCRSSEVRWCGAFEAWPRLMAFPVDYQWCLCGTVLEEGDGEVSTAHGPVSYKLRGRRLWLETELGQSLDCELCVSAIDARGQELFTCVQLAQPGVQKTCTPCVPSKGRYRVDVVQAAPALRGWRPLLDAVATVPPMADMPPGNTIR